MNNLVILVKHYLSKGTLDDVCSNTQSNCYKCVERQIGCTESRIIENQCKGKRCFCFIQKSGCRLFVELNS